MDERDCMFPDCLVREVYGCACEHSCPFEEDKEREAWAKRAPYSRDCLVSEVPAGE